MPEYTARARSLLGPGKLLCPELVVLLETDPAKARAAARTADAHKWEPYELRHNPCWVPNMKTTPGRGDRARGPWRRGIGLLHEW